MRAVVFSDVSSAELGEHIRAIASTSYAEVVYVDVSESSEADLATAWHTRYGGASHAPPAARDELDDLKNTFVCYLTEQKTLEDSDVVYAVFVAEVPTLVLTPSVTLTPLMHTTADGSVSARKAAIESLFSVAPSSSSAEVIVIEGGDGAGKETQTGLLVRRVHAAGDEVHALDFPNEKGLYGGLVRAVLSGRKGSISELNPQLFSFLYSLNRFGCARQLHFWLRRGSSVVLDRYYTANFGHQASKLPPEEREAFISDLEFMEVEWLGLPRATYVLYLDLPPAAALEAMRRDSTRKQLDIHETAGSDYKERVRQTYRWCCEHLPGWHHIECFDDDGRRLTREEVHASITSHLRDAGSRAIGAPS
ncbi:thymidylate kinase-like protein [Leishmania donovani]|uniref:Thymidylate_kinase-like_protein n=3 Tax=Leishmania donovani species complex TaxID=38574 RepID=A0A6L0WJM4_LEIIN|nr:thymidylate kinase-like protein [Leishmania infantum JPCM5]XP_003858845.1 thymidylate kinase-like protein [Leishmania donovani]CAC9456354.1 thymidylate_kinase-like_protein [Leishmania infantum]AYU76611.1 thymidylate kinase-like protein [Leishmania donovani]TPP46671.1 Thymidylate kinase family protein [Leishmania donovani]TPP51562.1 Thymidylate kinase family protein [Leishmania donovani]CAJ1986679.1 thymidylate kinase-like protein [Leishmania donovani]|eukprot:XP_001463654.1 thymidylate kinase-like protein [Leishmania infantum JPCM5]